MPSALMVKADDLRVAVVGHFLGSLDQLGGEFDGLQGTRLHPAHHFGLTVHHDPGELEQFAEVLHTLRPEQKVIDLVRISKNSDQARQLGYQYEGICW